MKKKIFIVLALLLILVPFVSVKALDLKEYFKADDTVSSSKEVKHSYFIAGDKLTSNDKIEGILFMAGNTLKAKNSLEYGFMAGNVIEVTGIVEKDLFIAGNDITIAENAIVGRDLYVAGNRVTINSNVSGNIFITADTIEFNDVTLVGDINLDCSNIYIGDDVQIQGALKYNEDAKIDGLKKEVKVETYVQENDETYNFVDKLQSKLFSTISLLIITLIIVAVFPGIYKKLSKEVTPSRVFKKMGLGFCVLVLVPIAAIILLFTVVCIPVSIIGLLLYGIFIYLSLAVSSTVIGNLVLTKLMKKNDNMYLSIIIGIVLVELLTFIPYIGGLIYFLLMLIGLGLILELLKPKSIKNK